MIPWIVFCFLNLKLLGNFPSSLMLNCCGDGAEFDMELKHSLLLFALLFGCHSV